MRRAILLTLLLTLVGAAVAHASATSVIRDCTLDGVLQGSYTQKELRGALANLPSDVDEYTNCRDIIRAAQLAGGSGGGGGTGSTPAATPGTSDSPSTPTGNAPGPFGGFSGFPADPTKGATKQERAVLAEAQSDPVGPQATQLASSVLPTPLVVALALGALGLIVLAALDLRRRVLARRGG
jgi:hypothetical protein